MIYFTLNNGINVPAISLGTALNDDLEMVAQTVCDAVDVGYTAIDTAEAYNNQIGIGQGIKRCGIERKDLYLSSKIWNNHHGYDEALMAFDHILNELDIEYLDQLLIHWPGQTESFIPTWKAYEKLYKEGRVRTIGVSNFLPHHLQRLLDNAEILPAVDQLELNPVFVPVETVSFCRDHNIQLEATRPICWGKLDRFPQIVEIARSHNKTEAQVVIRWHLQHGIRPLPKSTNKKRLLENISVFDFVLTDEEMTIIDSINTGKRETGQDPDTFWMISTDFKTENERILSTIK